MDRRITTEICVSQPGRCHAERARACLAQADREGAAGGVRRSGEEPLHLKLAKRIIDAAKKGERDPQRLCAKALDALGLNRH
jgi:hypothetical protein